MSYFEYLKSRMPHFFNGAEVLEYTPHSMSKSIIDLFDSSYYLVVDPNRMSLDNFDDNRFNVSMSINYFQYAPDYMEKFMELCRVSSKFVMFSCATAGYPPMENGFQKNLTQSDFGDSLDRMFETHRFHVDYGLHQLFFWGVKRSEV